MTEDTLYAYLASDFGQGLPADPVTVLQTATSLRVTLARFATPARLGLSAGAVAAPVQLRADIALEAGDPAEPLWDLLDRAKRIRLSAYRLTGDGGSGESCVVVTAPLPLNPGQSYELSLPVGPQDAPDPFIGGFATGTRILTGAGKRPIEGIGPGDTVWTATDGFQPVVWCGAQTLPARGIAAPVRLRQGMMGLTRDLSLAGPQAVLVETGSGPRLIPAAAFEAAGQATRDFGASVTFHSLLLPGHAVIFANGLPCESLWAPAMLEAGRPDDWPDDYPLPGAPAHPRLSEDEGRDQLG